MDNKLRPILLHGYDYLSIHAINAMLVYLISASNRDIGASVGAALTNSLSRNGLHIDTYSPSIIKLLQSW